MPDFLLKLYIERTPEKHLAYSYIPRIRDHRLATSLVLQYMEYWELDTCINLLKMCVSHLERGDESYETIAKSTRVTLLHMLLYDQILRSAIGHTFESWTELHDFSKLSPNKLIEDLLIGNEFSLAHKAALLFSSRDLEEDEEDIDNSNGVIDLVLHVQQQQILHLLKQMDNVSNFTNIGSSQRDEDSSDNISTIRTEILEILASLKENAVPVCEFLLDHPDLSYHRKLFVCHFATSVLRNDLPRHQLNDYTLRQKGMRVLCLLSSNYQRQFEHLICHPRLIIENLLMYQEVKLMETIFKDAPEMRDDDLLVQYGKKALALNASTQQQTQDTYETSNNASLPVDQTLVLTGDTQKDDQLRSTHRYPQAPSMLLAKSILDLCKEPRRAGQCMLNLCDDLSRTKAIPKHAAMVLIDQVNHYAKFCFLRDPEGHMHLPLCDHVFARSDLLKQIVNIAPDIEVSLSDLGVQSKARQIRDQLVQADHMELALKLSTQCQIETDPVWIEWGMSLLRIGCYPEARDKFRYCGGAPMQSTQKQLLLNRILVILEGTLPLRQIVQSLQGHKITDTASWDVSSSTETNLQYQTQRSGERIDHIRSSISLTMDHMDARRMKEAKYYIRLYGNDQTYVTFMARHGRIESAIQLIIERRLPPSFFVETVVTFCHNHGLLNQMQRVIKKIDPQLEKSLNYLMATCRYLSDLHAYTHLYHFQMFMRDELRAGLTCIRLFLKSCQGDTLESKINHLESAKRHFTAGMVQSQRGEIKGKPVLQPEEISKYLKTVSLQIEVSRTLHTSASREEQELSLFDTFKKKCDIIEALLNLSATTGSNANFDLAYKIMNEYHLPAIKLYMRTLSRLARKKQTTQINELLKNVKNTMVSDFDWDSMINVVIGILVNEVKDVKLGDRYIQHLRDDSKKVRACLLCQKYKAAYLIAVKSRNIEDIRFIAQYCSKVDNRNARTVLEHCTKFLATNKL